MNSMRLAVLSRPLTVNRLGQCLRQQHNRQALKQLLQDATRRRRYATGRHSIRYPPGTSVWTKTKDLWRENPFSVTVAFALIFAAIGCIGYANWLYQSYIIGAFHTFPEPVAEPLRKALYYTNVDPKPDQALKYYKQAIDVVIEIRMDPFTEEVLGIYIQLAAFYEKIHHYGRAIEVLETIRRDCVKWIDEHSGKEDVKEAQKAFVLGKTIQLSVKLGEIYSGEHVLELQKAEAHLVYAVETTLRELQRRDKEGVKPGDIEWMTPEAIGATFESLGQHYEAKNQYHLAGPLFLQALNLSPPGSCHTAVIMNNLATCIAQQNPPTEYTRHQPTPSRAGLVENARMWALKALEVAAASNPPERTEECDIACATATHNLGEFLEMDGRVREAKAKYDEARALAKAIGYKDGALQADAALARLAKRKE